MEWSIDMGLEFSSLVKRIVRIDIVLVLINNCNPSIAIMVCQMTRAMKDAAPAKQAPATKRLPEEEDVKQF